MKKVVKKFKENIKKIDEKSSKRYNILVLGVSAEMMTIVMALIIFVLSDVFGTYYLKGLSLIWILLAVLKIHFFEEVIETKNVVASDVLIWLNVLSFVFVEGFWLTPSLSLFIVLYIRDFDLFGKRSKAL